MLAKGMRPEMARLTLARKIATIVLIVWKRGVCFDAQHLKTTNSLSVSERFLLHLWGFLWRWPFGSRDTLVRERVSAGKLDAACFGHQVSHPTLGPLG